MCWCCRSSVKAALHENRTSVFNDNLEIRVLRTRSSPNWLCLLEHLLMQIPLQCCAHNAAKGEEHEQVRKSIACYLALSIPRGMGTEVPVPDVAGADWSGSAKMRDDVLSATRMRDRGNECPDRPRALVGQGAAEAIDLGVDGRPERTYCDPAVHGVSEFAQEAVLGQSFLGQGLLRGHGWAR